MRLGGEVEHGIRRVDQGSDHLRIGDVTLDEREPAGHLGVVPDGRQVGLVAGVGQLVEDRDPRPVAPAQDVADVGGADEPGPAGDEQTARRGPRPPQPTARVTGARQPASGVVGGGQLGSPQERRDRPGVGPVTLVHGAVEALAGDVVVEDVGDLELAAAGRQEEVDDPEGIRPEEVHADRDEVALGVVRLLLEADHPAVGVELGHAEALRVRDLVEQRAGPERAALELGGDAVERLAAQDVVAEDAAERVVADEVAGQPDGVGDAQRARLVAVGQVDAEGRAVRQQLDDVAHALATDDDHDLADAHPGERLDRVVDHRPVVDRQQVLVGDDRERVEPGRGAAGEDDALHRGQG